MRKKSVARCRRLCDNNGTPASGTGRLHGATTTVAYMCEETNAVGLENLYIGQTEKIYVSERSKFLNHIFIKSYVAGKTLWNLINFLIPLDPSKLLGMELQITYFLRLRHGTLRPRHEAVVLQDPIAAEILPVLSNYIHLCLMQFLGEKKTCLRYLTKSNYTDFFCLLIVWIFI